MKEKWGLCHSWIMMFMSFTVKKILVVPHFKEHKQKTFGQGESSSLQSSPKQVDVFSQQQRFLSQKVGKNGGVQRSFALARKLDFSSVSLFQLLMRVVFVLASYHFNTGILNPHSCLTNQNLQRNSSMIENKVLIKKQILQGNTDSKIYECKHDFC